MSKGRKKKQRKWISKNQSSTSSLSPKPSREKEPKSGKAWKLFVALVTIATAFFLFYDHCKSEQQQPSQATTKQGDLKPPKFNSFSRDTLYYVLESPPDIKNVVVSDSSPLIKGIHLLNTKDPLVNLIFGNTIIPFISKEKLYKGIGLKIPLLLHCGIYYASILFGVKDDRLYVSVQFKDLQKQEIVGIIEYNHWKLYLPNLFDFDSDDERLEVRDKQNNIIFSIKYDVGLVYNTVYVSGYFITPDQVSIIGCDSIPSNRVDTCVSKNDPDWYVKSSDFISKIKTIWPK